MDPLSITAAAVSFVDIARRIKDSVEKVGQTRRNLQQLVVDIIEDLTELQKLCYDEQGRLNHIDLDSTRSLQKLHSELLSVLESCLKLAERRRGSKGLSSVKYHLIAWVKNTEIEGHILHLRDRVSFVHRRFTMVASLRAERADNELLIVTSEMRLRMNRMESLLPPIFIASHALDVYPASALDHDLDGFDYQYLHRQVKKAIDLLGRISATHIFTVLESRGPLTMFFRSERGQPSRASLLRLATIRTLQLLDFDPSELSLWEGSKHLLSLGDCLEHLGLYEDAASIFIGIVNLYQTLMQRNPKTYLPCVAWGLGRLSQIHFGTPEGLDAAKRAVDICRETVLVLQEDYSKPLAESLHLYSDQLAANGRLDDALIYAAETLAVQRRAPTPQQGSNRLSVSWEASGEEHVALTSARTISRPYKMAVYDMIFLGSYAHLLESLNRWSEALIIATEVVHCLDALVHCYSDWFNHISCWLMYWRDGHQDLMSRTCPPAPSLAASISDVDDLDDLDREDSRKEGGYGAQSGLLVRV